MNFEPWERGQKKRTSTKQCCNGNCELPSSCNALSRFAAPLFAGRSVPIRGPIQRYVPIRGPAVCLQRSVPIRGPAVCRTLCPSHSKARFAAHAFTRFCNCNALSRFAARAQAPIVLHIRIQKPEIVVCRLLCHAQTRSTESVECWVVRELQQTWDAHI